MDTSISIAVDGSPGPREKLIIQFQHCNKLQFPRLPLLPYQSPEALGRAVQLPLRIV